MDDPPARAEVDSGRLAEPFWYTDSPLTTPDPSRPFAGRPPRGQLPPPGPGVLLPDVRVRLRRPCADGAVPTTTAALDPVRLRQVARAGVLVLVLPGADLVAAHRAADAVAAPVQVLGTDELDPDGDLAVALAARPGEVWVVRPDAHVAAVLTRPDTPAVVAALRRALGEDRRAPRDPRRPPATADRGGA